MRIIYYSKTFFTDCDFPLIREFQRIGASVWYFFPMDEGNTRQALLDIKQIKGKKGIFRASEYVETRTLSSTGNCAAYSLMASETLLVRVFL